MSASRTEVEFVEKLYDAIADARDYSQDTRWANFTPQPTSHLKQTLRGLADWAQRQNLRILLLCDEAEGLLYLAENSPVVLQNLRDTLQNHSAIRPVLASTRRLSRLYQQPHWDTSVFLDGFATHPLLNFRDETANQVITQAQSDLPLHIQESLLADIRQATGNHPLLLQKLCGQLFNPEQRTLRPVQPNDLEPDIQVTGFFQIDFNALTPDEAQLVHYICLFPSNLAQLENQFAHLSLKLALYNLTSLGFLRRIEDNYAIGNLFLTRWLETLPPHHTPQGGITNRMLREVAQERVAALQRQLIACIRHLGELELRQAKQGLETPPHVITEISDYQQKIADIEAELADLGQPIPSGSI
jgi:hypothetical protein